MHKIDNIDYKTPEVVGTLQRSFVNEKAARNYLMTNADAPDLQLFGNLANYTGNEFFYHKIRKI